MAAGSQPSATQKAAAAPAWQPPQLLHRWTLSSLQVCGGPLAMTDRGLKSLIGQRPNTLHTLALTNCKAMTPGFLKFLGTAHGSSLQHLRLEQCGAGPAPTATTSSSSSSGSGAVAAPPPAAAAGLQASVTPASPAAGPVSHPMLAWPPSSAAQGPSSLGSPGGSSSSTPGNSRTSSGAGTGAEAWPQGQQQEQAHAAGAPRKAAPFVWRITEQDFLATLKACPGLQSLRLRHVCQVRDAREVRDPSCMLG